MRLCRSRFRHYFAAISIGIAACRATPSSTPVPSPAPAAAACPAPTLGRIEWAFVDDSSGFTFALPRGFQEKPSGGSFRAWQLEGDFQQSMSFGLIRGNLPLSAYRRAYQPELMRDYSECSDTVADYVVSIQAWRTPNGVFRDYRRSDRYDVFAIWEAGPGVYVYISGGTYARATQDVMLGAIRSWRAKAR